MALLAIKGHKTRGSEVIALLKMLGGTNRENCCGVFENRLYLINAFDDIEDISLRDNSKYQIYTLEQFEEKFPYKVGDKVKCWINGYRSISTIKNIQWDSIANEVKYKIGDYWHSTMNLQPHKEKTMSKNICDSCLDVEGCWLYCDRKKQEMKENIDINLCDNKVITFNDCPHNEVELDLANIVHKKPQYPKTYEGCCNILKYSGNYYISLASNIDDRLFEAFYKLKICRDAYWHMAGDWKEKRKGRTMHYVICSTLLGEVVKDTMPNCIANFLLDFPTAEMRDSFYENFKDLIELVKELL